MNRRQSIKTALAASAAGLGAYNIAPAKEDLEGDGLPEGFSEYVDLKEAERIICPFHCHIDVSYEDRLGKGFRKECYETDCAEITIKDKEESGYNLVIEVTPLEDDAFALITYPEVAYKGKTMYKDPMIYGRKYDCPAETTITFKKICLEDIS